MDFSIQGLPGVLRGTWLYRSRIVSWSGMQLVLLSLGFLATLMASFSSGAWLGQHLNMAMSRHPSEMLAAPGQELDAAGGPLEPDMTLTHAEPMDVQELPSAVTVSYTIEKYDNLFDVLHSFGVRPDTIRHWTRLCRPYYNISRVRPGQSFDLALDDANEPLLFVFHISSSRYLVVEAGEDGYSARLEDKKPDMPGPRPEKPGLVSVPFRYLDGRIQFQDPQTGDWATASKATVRAAAVSRTARRYYEGRVNDSFYRAAEKAGLNASRIMELIDIFACEVDFRKDIRKGDSFRVLMARPGDNPKPVDKQIVVAAMIETGKKPHWAFYHRDGKGSGYYDERGQSLKGFSLIVPVKYTRISSGYTSRRFHPILRIYRPHYGVDYAAPYGTPIRAASSGTITYCGWKGGYGRYIQVQHNSKYATSYGHLSRYARGIRKGKRVRQGQVIGYVGSSGLATGPHLDYQIFRYSKRINPLRFHGEKGGRVPNINAFQITKARLMREIERTAGASRGMAFTSSAAGS